MFGLALPEGRFTTAEINVMLAVYELAGMRMGITSNERRLALAHMIVDLAQALIVDRTTLLRAVLEQMDVP
jgi:hypothetical protein